MHRSHWHCHCGHWLRGGKGITATSSRDGGNQSYFQEAATSKFSFRALEQVVFVSKLPLQVSQTSMHYCRGVCQGRVPGGCCTEPPHNQTHHPGSSCCSQHSAHPPSTLHHSHTDTFLHAQDHAVTFARARMRGQGAACTCGRHAGDGAMQHHACPWNGTCGEEANPAGSSTRRCAALLWDGAEGRMCVGTRRGGGVGTRFERTRWHFKE